MRKLLLYLVLLLAPAPLLAQENSSDSVTGDDADGHGGEGPIIGPIFNLKVINYTYDAAGNRILNSNGILPHFGNGSGNDGSGSAFNVSDKAVSLSGTNGSYLLTLSTWGMGDTGQLGVYSTGGQLVTSKTIVSTDTTVDLTSSPDGVYIIYVKVNADAQAFEFIKK